MPLGGLGNANGYSTLLSYISIERYARPRIVCRKQPVSRLGRIRWASAACAFRAKPYKLLAAGTYQLRLDGVVSIDLSDTLLN